MDGYDLCLITWSPRLQEAHNYVDLHCIPAWCAESTYATCSTQTLLLVVLLGARQNDVNAHVFLPGTLCSAKRMRLRS